MIGAQQGLELVAEDHGVLVDALYSILRTSVARPLRGVHEEAAGITRKWEASIFEIDNVNRTLVQSETAEPESAHKAPFNL